jgi:hypothetical protein
VISVKLWTKRTGSYDREYGLILMPNVEIIFAKKCALYAASQGSTASARVYTAEWGLVFFGRLKSAGCFLSRIAGLHLRCKIADASVVKALFVGRRLFALKASPKASGPSMPCFTNLPAALLMRSSVRTAQASLQSLRGFVGATPTRFAEAVRKVRKAIWWRAGVGTLRCCASGSGVGDANGIFLGISLACLIPEP